MKETDELMMKFNFENINNLTIYNKTETRNDVRNGICMSEKKKI